VIVEIRGTDLPGASCGPAPDGGRYEGIHVGVAKGTETVELVPGDAAEARWQFEIDVRDGPDGMDYRGPFVHGKRGERHLGLRWVTIQHDGSLPVFRAAKLRFHDVRAQVLVDAVRRGRLVASLGLTDEHGWPRCASVRPPLVTWTAEDG
jgi:hypothetical protein